jgi:hypothetical protein
MLLHYYRLSATCTSYSYSLTFLSVTGTFDATTTLSAGTPVPTTRRATSADVQLSADATSAVQLQLGNANGQITSLTARLSTAEGALSTAQAALTTATAAIQALNVLTADYTSISNAVSNLTNCHGFGMLLAADGVTCQHTVPQCAQPAGLPAGVSLSWGPGECITYPVSPALDSTVSLLACVLRALTSPQLRSLSSPYLYFAKLAQVHAFIVNLVSHDSPRPLLVFHLPSRVRFGLQARQCLGRLPQ